LSGVGRRRRAVFGVATITVNREILEELVLNIK
jgi:hypothetical protein